MKWIGLFSVVIFGMVGCFAQGTIDFINRNIGTAANPTVLYNVPIYAPGGRATGTGAGTLPGGVTVGLFMAGAADDATPLAATPLRTDTPFRAQFFAISPQTVVVAGVPAGSTAALMVRIWQGPSYVEAKAIGSSLLFGEYHFTSLPLGGSPPNHQMPVQTPGTNFGPESGFGIELAPLDSQPPPDTPEPSAIALAAVGLGALLLRRKRR